MSNRGCAEAFGHNADANLDEMELKRRQDAQHRQTAKDWLCRDEGDANLDELYVLRRCLSPELHLMSDTVRLNHDSYDIAQMRGAANRQEYRVKTYHLDSLPGGRFCRTIKTCVTQYCDNRVWSHLEHSRATCSSLTRLCLRAPAVLHMLVVRRCAGWPYKLFSLLGCDDQETAAGIMYRWEGEKCLMDAVSARFLELYPAAAAAITVPAQALLRCLALQIVGNTWAIETLHSANSRRTRMRVQTHTMPLQEIMLLRSTAASPVWMPQQRPEKEVLPIFPQISKTLDLIPLTLSCNAFALHISS